MPTPSGFSLRNLVSSFRDAASGSVQGCAKGQGPGAQPQPQSAAPSNFYYTVAPPKPCNLLQLEVVEPKAEPGGKEGTRAADFLVTSTRLRDASPLKLRAGADCLQITAKSESQGPRQINVTARLDACCGSEEHMRLHVAGPDVDSDFPGTQMTLRLARAALPTDKGASLGFWAFVDAAWQMGASPATYEIRAESCGLPTRASVAPLASALGRIEVFPADKYELSLSIPALLEPAALNLDRKTDRWKTDAELRDAAQERDADAYYESHETFFREAGVSRHDIRDFVSARDKMQSGEDDHDYLGKLKVSFRQTDGNREISAPTDDLIKLVRMIRNAEYAAKSVGDWVSAAQVGPGASFKIECQFLAGTIKASWMRMEHTDDRVFLGWKAELKISLVKLGLTLAVGWRCAGLADLFVELGGEGELTLSGSAACKSPDAKAECALEPGGKLGLTGKVKGQLMWAVSGETGLECEFEADCGDVRFMKGGRPLSGSVVVKRGPVNRTLEYGCRMFGGTAEKEEVIAGNDRFASFELGA